MVRVKINERVFTLSVEEFLRFLFTENFVGMEILYYPCKGRVRRLPYSPLISLFDWS